MFLLLALSLESAGKYARCNVCLLCVRVCVCVEMAAQQKKEGFPFGSVAP